jgi:hypothetical protein
MVLQSDNLFVFYETSNIKIYKNQTDSAEFSAFIVLNRSILKPAVKKYRLSELICFFNFIKSCQYSMFYTDCI